MFQAAPEKLSAALQRRLAARKFEEARRVLLAHAGGESDRADVECAA
ncbi:MAG: hypothetical protein QOG71_1849 [Pyrinomonadaceae bacterium]|nr:hypothetical protein [Pyrinomonadaceae bacterium]